MREIEFDKIEEIKEAFSFTYRQIAELLGVHECHVNKYKRCGRLPADRYYAMRDGLLVSNMQESRETENKIMQLFS